MSNEEYHSLDGLSSTQFQDLDLSVAIYDNRHLFKYDCEAFRIGTLNHIVNRSPFAQVIGLALSIPSWELLLALAVATNLGRIDVLVE